MIEHVYTLKSCNPVARWFFSPLKSKLWITEARVGYIHNQVQGILYKHMDLCEHMENAFHIKAFVNL